MPLCAFQTPCPTTLATRTASSLPLSWRGVHSRASTGSPMLPARFSPSKAGTHRSTHAHCHLRMADVAQSLAGTHWPVHISKHSPFICETYTRVGLLGPCFKTGARVQALTFHLPLDGCRRQNGNVCKMERMVSRRFNERCMPNARSRNKSDGGNEQRAISEGADAFKPIRRQRRDLSSSFLACGRSRR